MKIASGFSANAKAVAISLIPYTYHALVIKSAIRKKVNVVTTSYVSPSMTELEKDIHEAGITVMNEIGLDPGIGKHCFACLSAVCIEPRSVEKSSISLIWMVYF